MGGICGEVYNGTCELEALLANIASLERRVEEREKQLMEDLVGGTNSVWIIMSAVLVIFMQAGFAMLEAGAIRSKNVRSILLKNVVDFSVGTMSFWAFGYSFAFGRPLWGGAIGTDLFFLQSTGPEKINIDYEHFLFMLPFAATAATIVSGSVAERTRLNSYLLISFFLSGFMTPVVMHWAWSTHGWLSPLKEDPLFGCGFVDFAGSGVIHTTGGLVALIGAYYIGPRHDEKGIPRFNPSCRPRDFIGHNIIFTALGVFMLWFGWYGFNAGSTIVIVGSSAIAARVVVNTTIAAASASVTVYIFETFGGNDIALCLNGVLAGLVSITAPCAVVNTWQSFIIGLVGACVYECASRGLVYLEIDDPLDASAIHTGCGVWGVLSVGLFAQRQKMQEVYNLDHYGLLNNGGWSLFAAQVVGLLVIALWIIVLSVIMFVVIKNGLGWIGLDPSFNMLRVPFVDEIQGLDVSYHDGWEYPPFLWPLVENLKALHKVQEKLTVSSSHMGYNHDNDYKEGPNGSPAETSSLEHAVPRAPRFSLGDTDAGGSMASMESMHDIGPIFNTKGKGKANPNIRGDPEDELFIGLTEDNLSLGTPRETGLPRAGNNGGSSSSLASLPAS